MKANKKTVLLEIFPSEYIFQENIDLYYFIIHFITIFFLLYNVDSIVLKQLYCFITLLLMALLPHFTTPNYFHREINELPNMMFNSTFYLMVIVTN